MANRRLSRLWPRLSVAATVLVVVWTALGLLGLVRLLSSTPAVINAGLLGDTKQRQATWAPTYYFGIVCQPKLEPGTSLALVDPSHADPAGFDPRMPFDKVNLGAFQYALYPHLVTHLGALPDYWTPGALSTDYIAVWQQTDYRSDSERNAAQRSADVVSASLASQSVCVYQNSRGDHGAIFAVSPRAQAGLGVSSDPRQASQAPIQGNDAAPPPHLSQQVIGYVLGLLGLAGLWLIGLLLLVFLPRAFAWSMMFALAFPLGCLAVSVEMVLMSLLGIRWSLGVLAAPWIVLAAVQLWRRRDTLYRWPGYAWPHFRPGQELARLRLAADEKVAVALLVAGTSVASFLAVFELPELDGFGVTYFKAQAFWLDGGVVPYYRHLVALLFSDPAHPPFAALPVVWLYYWVGHIDERVSLLVWPAFLVALLGSFYVLARSAAPRRLALWTTVGFAFIGWPGKIITAEVPFLRADTVITSPLAVGWADLPLAVFLVLGCGLLIQMIGSERPSLWQSIIAGVLLGGGAWTKEEGLTAALAALAATCLIIMWRRRHDIAQRRYALAPLVCSAGGFGATIILPLLIQRVLYPAPGFRNEGSFLHLLSYSAGGFARFAVLYWLAPLLLMGVVVMRRLWRRQRLTPLLRIEVLLLGSVVLAQTAVDVVVIAAIMPDIVGVQDEMVSAGARLLLQLQPLVYLGTLIFWLDLTRATRDAAGSNLVRPADMTTARTTSVQQHRVPSLTLKSSKNSTGEA